MAVATIGAMILGEYYEGVAVMLFYQIGELFQSCAVAKSRKNIAGLMDIRPDYANVLQAGEYVKVDPDEVQIGQQILIKPGERIPIDSIVVDGVSTLDTAALTGESVPRRVSIGDELISGCINLSGILTATTTKEFGESTVSRILDLVENATSKKSTKENFISRFARVYTPTVCALALALAVFPTVVGFAFEGKFELAKWLYRALTFLVISCPCALVISIPLAFFAGIGGAGKAGVLIKGSNYLERLSNIKYLVTDKTGTLTEGVFTVTKVYLESEKKVYTTFESEEVLSLIGLAAMAEQNSNHPIAKSILDLYVSNVATKKENGVRRTDLNCKLDKGELFAGSMIPELTEIPGQGIVSIVGDKKIFVGNIRLMQNNGVSVVEQKEAGLVCYIAQDEKYLGYIVVSDRLKPTAKNAISQLKKLGINEVIMLTGDAEGAAALFSKELGIEKFYARLLPEDKVSKVEELLAEKAETEELAFVGDGVNDAPVLTRADIGIAMGAMGQDAAIEAADVVLMDDDPLKIIDAIKISKKCMRIVYENIYFAIGVKVICLLLGAFGIANMWTAIFADVGVMIIAVLNSIRALKAK